MGIESVKIGPCQLFWNGVDLGYTIGGVEVTVAYEINDSKSLGHLPGHMPMIRGVNVEIKTQLAESTFENYIAGFPGSIYSSSGQKKKLSISDVRNVSLRQYGKELILKPIGGTTNEWITIPKAVAAPNATIQYNNKDIRSVGVVFMAIPFSRQNPTLIVFGDTTT